MVVGKDRREDREATRHREECSNDDNETTHKAIPSDALLRMMRNMEEA